MTRRLTSAPSTLAARRLTSHFGVCSMVCELSIVVSHTCSACSELHLSFADAPAVRYSVFYRALNFSRDPQNCRDAFVAQWRREHPDGALQPRLFTVGRLDVASVGLIFVTNDGAGGVTADAC